MKLRIMSDLHLEFGGAFEVPELPNDENTILILAGDIHTGPNAENFIRDMCTRFWHVIYVPGNHEYYNYDMTDVDYFWTHEFEALDFTYLNNDVFRFAEGNRFMQILGGTMWTPMGTDDPDEWHIRYVLKQGMNDFAVIRRNKRRFLPEQAARLHEDATEYFNETFTPDTIMVTHHLPTWRVIDEEYLNKPNILNHAFAASMDKFIVEHKPKLWIYGHTHKTTFKRVNGTRMICNPRGYFPYDLNPEFDPCLMIDTQDYFPYK